ncbi:MAG: inositol monophosphatase [Planctomycetota bacterium]|nr:inositol monophosphatase [Planctomycetota bacterium]
MNSSLYSQIRDFVLQSGSRIRNRAGKLDDIGVAKSFLTEEDLRIETELAALLGDLAPSHAFYAEEKHDREIGDAENVWVCDPISGTHTFLAGMAHFGIVVAHVHKGEPVFALVLDPSTDELFEARLGEGATCNGLPIHVNDKHPFAKEGPRITFNLTYNYRDPDEAAALFQKLTQSPGAFDLYRNTNSFGVNICHVACGRYDGVIALTKDSFPEVAGSLILREAGGIFETFDGSQHIAPQDRRFLGGSKRVHEALRCLLTERS